MKDKSLLSSYIRRWQFVIVATALAGCGGGFDPANQPLPPRSLAVVERVYNISHFSFGGRSRPDGTVAYFSHAGDFVRFSGVEAGAHEMTLRIKAEIAVEVDSFPRVLVQQNDQDFRNKIVEFYAKSTNWQDYRFNISTAGGSLLVFMANDYWNPVSGQGVNMWLESVSLSRIVLNEYNFVGTSFQARWDANTEADLSHYRIHLGIAPRNYNQRIVTGRATEYRFVDLATDVTYYVAVTAVDSAGNESEYSEERVVRLSSGNTVSFCDLDGNGKTEPADFILADAFKFHDRSFIKNRYAPAEGEIILRAFDRLDFDKSGRIEPGELVLFDSKCKF